MIDSHETLSNLLHEKRRFGPPAELAADANVQAEAYARADGDRLAFWAEQAARLDWATPYEEVLDWSNPPFAKWFVGGKLNAAYNCVPGTWRPAAATRSPSTSSGSPAMSAT